MQTWIVSRAEKVGELFAGCAEGGGSQLAESGSRLLALGLAGYLSGLHFCCSGAVHSYA